MTRAQYEGLRQALLLLQGRAMIAGEQSLVKRATDGLDELERIWRSIHAAVTP